MNGPPSPESSPSLTPAIPSYSRKRQRSLSMQSSGSSSKRSPSEPARDASAREEPIQTNVDEVDAYMTEQPNAEDTDSPFAPPHAGRLDWVNQQLEATKMVPATYWYLVAYPWWRRWEKLCTGEVDKEGRVDQVGPVDNSTLLDKHGSLINPIQEKVDVMYVPSPVWTHLVQWYGTPKHTLRRRVIERGESYKEILLELWPPVLKAFRVVAQLPAPSSDTMRQVTVSCQDPLKKLCTELQKAFETPNDRWECRIWRIDSPDFDPSSAKDGLTPELLATAQPKIIKEDNTTVEDALINPGDIFAVEFKENNQWIYDSTELTRESTASTEPKPLFGNDNFFNRMGQNTTRSTTTSIQPKVTTMSVRSKACEPGTLGLGNMGNTCFMNSALQCLAHTKELVDYFLTGVYKNELNPDNPLGMHGAIAEQFGALLHRIWDKESTSSSYSPREFKSVLQRFAPQFSGYQQHDSQELVAFLLDGLHEDLNRVLKKPYVENPDWEGGGDFELAQLAKKSWDGYMLRNDSVIVDLFQGQYQSTLVCPECQKVSITFDPFMYLTLPLPVTKKWKHKVFYVPWDNAKPHVEMPVEIGRDASIKELRQLIGRWMGVPPDNLLTLEIWHSSFYKNLIDSTPCGEIAESDILVCFELPCHAQQSRSYTPHPDDPYILPVYLHSQAPPTNNRFSSNRNLGFGYPFIVVISQEQAKRKETIYEAIVDRLERWTSAASDLYSWEATTVGIDEVPITLGTSQPMDTIAEFRENGDVVTVPDIPEGDIVDQKIAMEDMEIIPPAGTIATPPKRLGVKDSVFELGISPNHPDYGTKDGLAPFNQIKWTERLNDEGEPLLRSGDALVCTFEENIKDYFFGSSPRFERGRWEIWEKFIHPEYQEMVAASTAKKTTSISLQDCLDEFTKEEQLGEDDLWYCPRCKKHQQAKKRFDLWKVPDVLVVHLKRFSNTRSLRDKIDALVDFPIEGLDLESMVGERKVGKALAAQGVDLAELGVRDPDGSLVYDLFGVDEHLGGLGGGHYRAYALNHMADKWYHFDDSYVTPSSASDSVNANAYLLFYRRRSSKPLGGKTYEKVESAKANPPASEPTLPLASSAQLPTPPNEPAVPLDELPSYGPYLHQSTSFGLNPYSPARSVAESDDAINSQTGGLHSNYDMLDSTSQSYDYGGPSSTQVSPDSSLAASPPGLEDDEEWTRDDSSNASKSRTWEEGMSSFEDIQMDPKTKED